MIELSTPVSGANGRVALVTGAARGIGLGIAAWLISEGWQVVLTDLDRERGSKVAKALGEHAWFITMDVADEEQVTRGVAEVLGQFGRLDALVCNAAVAEPRNITLESLDLAYWNRVLAVNPIDLRGTRNIVLASEYTMRRIKKGPVADTTGWYVMGGYRFGSVLPYVSFSKLKVDEVNVPTTMAYRESSSVDVITHTPVG